MALLRCTAHPGTRCQAAPCRMQQRWAICPASASPSKARPLLLATAASGAHSLTAPSSCAAAMAAVLLLLPLGAEARSINEIKDAVQQDFVERQYYVTGRLTRDLYEPDCRFVDPTTDVKGVEPYTRAVAALFDAAESRADLLDIAVTDPHTITLHWRLEGKLRLGGLRIKPYTGTTRYTIDNAGLIASHQEAWDISAVDAFVSTLFPSFGAPPAPPVR